MLTIHEWKSFFSFLPTPIEQSDLIFRWTRRSFTVGWILVVALSKICIYICLEVQRTKVWLDFWSSCEQYIRWCGDWDRRYFWTVLFFYFPGLFCRFSCFLLDMDKINLVKMPWLIIYFHIWIILCWIMSCFRLILRSNTYITVCIRLW